MDSESTTSTTPIHSATGAKTQCKKKKLNRSAKLKQNKIDARREQWLSQGAVKNKGCKDGVDGDSFRLPLLAAKHCKYLLKQLETRRDRDGSMICQDSDLDSPSNSLSSDVSGTNFTGTSSSGSSRSCSSSSAGCCSGNITEEEECLDDWEAVADALAAYENHQHQNPCYDSPPQPILQTVLPDGLNFGARKLDCAGLVPLASGNNRAWRANDACRPQTLPDLSKQLSVPDRYCGGGSPWTRLTMPSSCPICCEDLDLTDSSFLPCLCGFRLCLFCHKRILEEDGRCPGCRKPYECEPSEMETQVVGGSLTLRLACLCKLD